ncbi:DUF5309 family protein [Candidatus Pacearchaeota archaeon]|nr:DUF5309 family protein [Candidatus Pacearchaeota archaeon]
MAGFLGMRGTEDWADDQRPKNWREGILYLYPNGMAPLTAILSKAKSEKVDDPEFNWWTKTLPAQGGAVTAGEIFTDTLLNAAVGDASSEGDTVYVQVAVAVANEFKEGHQVLLRDTSDYTVDVTAKVTAVHKNGASSYIACKLLEDDDNSTAGGLSDVDRILIIGSVNAEGAGMPDPISYNPVKVTNYTQIFRTSLEITRTARATKLRTGDAYRELKREALELHSIEMEKAYIWGQKSENTSAANGKPERTTMGLIPAIRDGASANMFDYTTDTDYSGSTWIIGGEDWLDNKLEQIFRYGAADKLAFCGSGALLGIQQLAKSMGQINLTPTSTSYGIKVVTWITPFGIIHLKTHPLFSYETTNRNTMLVFEPAMLRYRFIDDTKFVKDKDNTGANRIDGTAEEFLTEAGLEYHHPLKFGLFNGVGSDNSLS